MQTRAACLWVKELAASEASLPKAVGNSLKRELLSAY